MSFQVMSYYKPILFLYALLLHFFVRDLSAYKQSNRFFIIYDNNSSPSAAYLPAFISYPRGPMAMPPRRATIRRNIVPPQIRDEEWKKRSGRWILVVDDEESIRSFVGQYLIDAGYQVTLCSDAPSALQVTTNFTSVVDDVETKTRTRDIYSKAAPDAIVTDIRMPGPLDGLGLLREIRADERLRAIPVILLTAKGKTQDRVTGYDYGADVYLPKPFDPDELVAILDSVIERHEMLGGTGNDGLTRVSIQDLQQDVYQIKKLLTKNEDKMKRDDVSLSMDERTVLKLLCQGWTNKEISQQLNYSIRRVEQHLTSMFRKTQCNNRTALVRWAFDKKVVDL